MMTIISLLLLASLLSHLTLTVNGREAKPHSRPYMVSVQLNGRHICGGSLVSDHWVLTAAQCWKRNENLTVVVGAHDLSESKNSDHIGVESYIQHPNYMVSYHFNNIMLLKLQEKVNITNYVKSISLPKNKEDVEANTLCSVAGWGRLKIEGPKSDRLMEANVCIINESECYERWGNVFSDKQMMCAYGHGGSCYFDSGGPLVCGDTAIGVTAFGNKLLCNSPEKPNGYIKISPYIPWINSKIR